MTSISFAAKLPSALQYPTMRTRCPPVRLIPVGLIIVPSWRTTWTPFARYRLYGENEETTPESAGVPEAVHARADLAVRVPMHEGLRSLNVAVAGAMVLAEALRQTDGWPS